jgi:hypothetical protein
MSAEQMWDSLLTLVFADVDERLRGMDERAKPVYEQFDELSKADAKELLAMTQDGRANPMARMEQQRQDFEREKFSKEYLLNLQDKVSNNLAAGKPDLAVALVLNEPPCTNTRAKLANLLVNADYVSAAFEGPKAKALQASINQLKDESRNADPDGDGLSALLEYALAASPAVSAAAPRYELGVASGRLTLSFLRETAAGDLTWTVEATNDLATTWTPIARRTPTDTTWTILTVGAAAVESNGQVVITDSTVLATQPRRFLRLRAETAP